MYISHKPLIIWKHIT